MVYFLGGVLVRERVVLAACVVAGGLAYSHSHMGYIPSWLSWNYVGYEGKPTWDLFSKEIDPEFVAYVEQMLEESE